MAYQHVYEQSMLDAISDIKYCMKTNLIDDDVYIEIKRLIRYEQLRTTAIVNNMKPIEENAFRIFCLVNREMVAFALDRKRPIWMIDIYDTNVTKKLIKYWKKLDLQTVTIYKNFVKNALAIGND